MAYQLQCPDLLLEGRSFRAITDDVQHEIAPLLGQKLHGVQQRSNIFSFSQIAEVKKAAESGKRLILTPLCRGITEEFRINRVDGNSNILRIGAQAREIQLGERPIGHKAGCSFYQRPPVQ